MCCRSSKTSCFENVTSFMCLFSSLTPSLVPLCACTCGCTYRRPAHQSDWGMDGRSILPLLKAPPAPAQTQMVYADGTNVMPIHGMGWCVVPSRSSSHERTVSMSAPAIAQDVQWLGCQCQLDSSWFPLRSLEVRAQQQKLRQ